MKALGQGSVASYMKVALDVIWVVLAILAVVLIVTGVAYAGALIAVAAGWLSADVLAGVNVSTEITQGAVPGGAMSWPVVAPALLAGIVAVGGGLVIVGRLKKLFANFTSNQPFLMENADHLRAIWIAMLVVEVSRMLISAAIGAALSVFGQPEAGQMDVSIKIELTNWAAIIILMVLAEVFREGARMREDQELTI